MSNCVNDVALAMAGAKLTAEENRLVDEWCDGAPAFMIVRVLKFNRATVELREMIKKMGLAGDEELWGLAFELLAKLMDPSKALAQAKSELDKRRATKAIQAIPGKIKKIREGTQKPRPDGSAPRGGAPG